MSGFWRTLATWAVGTILSLEAATLICVPAGLGPNWWLGACGVFAVAWGLYGDRVVGRTVTAWKQLGKTPTLPARPGDGPTLLALFAMHEGPVHLVNVVMVLNPCPNPPSWLHPCRRWRVMTAWAVRFGELVAEVGRLTEAGLLRCAERARPRGMSLYEITGLGRDVAARNAEVLMNHLTEERA